MVGYIVYTNTRSRDIIICDNMSYNMHTLFLPNPLLFEYFMTYVFRTYHTISLQLTDDISHVKVLEALS